MSRNKLLAVLLFLGMFFPSAFTFGEETTFREDSVYVTLLSKEEAIRPGATFSLELAFHVPKGWHLYGKGADSTLPHVAPKISWDLPKGFSVVGERWPAPLPLEGEPPFDLGYEDSFTVGTTFAVPEGYAIASTPISVDVEWIACSSSLCQPSSFRGTLLLPLVVSIESPERSLDSSFEVAMQVGALPRESGGSPGLGDTLYASFFLALGMAFLGGVFLNLMPCVLPVLSFKVLSFLKMAAQENRSALYHGIAFTLGILFSFWFLALLLFLLRSYGHEVGWGFQLQEPLFVGSLALLFVLLALAMFGVMEIGAFFAAWVADRSQTFHRASSGQTSSEGGSSLVASFGSGILATAVATPCTGPFLGSALGLAMVVPAWQGLLIFTFLGMGMASPYLLLSAFPGCLRFVPKPGPWMVTCKEMIAFTMMATALWLVWVFSTETSSNGTALLLGSLLVASFACWIYGKWVTPFATLRVRLTTVSLVSCIGVCSLYLLSLAASSSGDREMSPKFSDEEIAWLDEKISSRGEASEELRSHLREWHPFDPKRLEQCRRLGIPVFVDFTASWCLLCQTNQLLIDGELVSRRMEELGMVKMKADWTKRDAKIAEWLRRLGRSGVPLYLLFTGEGDPQILPQLLTTDLLLEALEGVAKP